MPSTYDATTKVGFTRPTMQDYEEHSRSGDASTGRPLKYVQEVPNQIIVDEQDTDNVYLGESVPNAASSQALWRIRKIMSTGGLVYIQMADGNDNFDNIWDNRTSLTYS